MSLGQTSAGITSADTDTSENSNENTSDTKAQEENDQPATENTDENNNTSSINEEKDMQTGQTDAAQKQESRTGKSAKNLRSAELTVSISASSLTAAYGTEIVLTGTVSDESALLQWQRMGSDGVWEDIDGENTTEYRFIFNEENASYQYRLSAAAGTAAEDTVYSSALSITRQLLLLM